MLKKVYHLLSILIRVAKDKSFEQLQKLHKGKFSYRVCELNRRHKKADEMLSSGVVPIVKSDTMWEVPSQSNSDAVHIVELQEHICACKMRCSVCKVCTRALV